METANHEYYVSLEISKLLKKAGFDWKCSGIYVLDSENDPEYVFSTANFTNTSKEIEGYIRLSAPTLDIAQRWLREVKGVDINILVESISNHKQYLVSIWFNISDKSAYDNAVLDNRYNIYEKAQEAGIKNALEIILEKGD